VSYFDSPIAMPSYETLTLERLRFGLQEHVGAEMLHSMQIEAVEEKVWGGMIYRLKASVLAEKLPSEKFERSETFTLDFPASSWQHFKQEHSESWWLRWLVQRRPVRLQGLEQTATLTVDLERYRTFPLCNYVFPKELGPFVNVAVTRDNWSLR
jgi:hypothetical protein